MNSYTTICLLQPSVGPASSSSGPRVRPTSAAQTVTISASPALAPYASLAAIALIQVRGTEMTPSSIKFRCLQQTLKVDIVHYWHSSFAARPEHKPAKEFVCDSWHIYIVM